MIFTKQELKSKNIISVKSRESLFILSFWSAEITSIWREKSWNYVYLKAKYGPHFDLTNFVRFWDFPDFHDFQLKLSIQNMFRHPVKCKTKDLLQKGHNFILIRAARRLLTSKNSEFHTLTSIKNRRRHWANIKICGK